MGDLDGRGSGRRGERAEGNWADQKERGRQEEREEKKEATGSESGAEGRGGGRQRRRRRRSSIYHPAKWARWTGLETSRLEAVRAKRITYSFRR